MTDPDTSGDTVRHDNVFDLDEELQYIELRGMAKYGIENGALDEPSQPAVTRWRRMLYVSQRQVRPDLPEDATDDQVVEALLARDWDGITESETDAFAVLCSNTPPKRSRPMAPEAPTKPRRGEKTTDTQHARAMERHQEKLDEHAEAVVKHEADLAEWVEEWDDSGFPTREQLIALPFRPKAKLFGYLTAAFMNPTGAAGNAATSG